MDKSSGIHACLGPSDLVGIAVKPDETYFGLVLSPTFMLGIWHRGDWMKEIFGSALSMVGWYMEVPILVGILILIRTIFPILIYEYL